MKKHKTLDQYNVFKIEKDNKSYFLANREDYQSDIDNLLSNLDNLYFDSILFIFGFDSGDYLESLENKLCHGNKVIILEPNEDIFNQFKDSITNKNISLVKYDEVSLRGLLYTIVSWENFNNLYVHSFGNYSQVYKDEYDTFLSILSSNYYNACSALSIAGRFKKVFIENMVANLNQINNSSPIDSFKNLNKNVPAIVVSAGPSIDKNVKDMVKNKEKLKDTFIIAGNRTLKILLEHDIVPDLVVSLDPIDANYEMVKDYLHLNIPLAFYEYSNRYLVKEHKGDKVYMSTLFSQTIEDLNKLTGAYLGGSVAHTCVDIAHLLGCNPIILAGQDLAYTYDKHHGDGAVFDIDKDGNHNADQTIKDVYGNDINTTSTLNFFNDKMAEYIELINFKNDYEFINVSYGANILGTIHKELDDVLNSDIFKNKKNNLYLDTCLDINASEIIDSVSNHIDVLIEKSHICIDLCKDLVDVVEDKNLMEMDEEDIDLQKFLFIMEVANEFENTVESQYLGGYLTLFLFSIKQQFFKMKSNEYSDLTSNLHYQGSVFLNYFTKLEEMLIEIKELFKKSVSEFY